MDKSKARVRLDNRSPINKQKKTLGLPEKKPVTITAGTEFRIEQGIITEWSHLGICQFHGATFKSDDDIQVDANSSMITNIPVKVTGEFSFPECDHPQSIACTNAGISILRGKLSEDSSIALAA